MKFIILLIIVILVSCNNGIRNENSIFKDIKNNDTTFYKDTNENIFNIIDENKVIIDTNRKGNRLQKRNSIMLKFDIVKYKKNKSNNNTTFVLADSTLVTQSEDRTIYQEVFQKRNSPFRIIQTYSKVTRGLKSRSEYFYECPIGIYEEFDSNGSLIKKINYDSGFVFSIDKLIEKIKSELEIDLNLINSQVYITRYKTPKAHYFIRLPLNQSRIRILKIDGITGVIFYNEEIEVIY